MRAASFGELGQGQRATAVVPVTPRAEQARFTLDWTGSDFDLALMAPSGRTIDEVSADTDVTVIQTASSVSIAVASPEAGEWQIEAFASDVPAPEPVSYEVSESGVPLHAALYATHSRQAGLPIDVVFTMGEPAGGVAGANVVAAVTDPAGSVRVFVLRDDGASGDTDSSDGVYGARLWATDVAGSYSIEVTASGRTAGGAPIQRQATVVVSLDAKVDTDGDGVADGAEPVFDLDPTDPSDGSTDHDWDGLGLHAELVEGTDPASWDTDEGGEHDRSELTAGRDPLQADDDTAFDSVLIGALPRDGNLVDVYLRTTAGNGLIHLFRLSGPDITDLGLHPASGATVTDGPLREDHYTYLALAVAANGAESIPYLSGPVPVGSDVTPPDFRIILNGDRWETTDPAVTVSLTDLTEPVTDMRLANSAATLETADWIPFSASSSITVPSQFGQHFVYAQVRDAAGNESRVASAFVFLVDEPSR